MPDLSTADNASAVITSLTAWAKLPQAATCNVLVTRSYPISLSFSRICPEFDPISDSADFILSPSCTLYQDQDLWRQLQDEPLPDLWFHCFCFYFGL